MAYVVNEDTPTDSALVHSDTCEALHRRVSRRTPEDGRWHGPYDSEDEALAEARATECDLMFV